MVMRFSVRPFFLFSAVFALFFLSGCGGSLKQVSLQYQSAYPAEQASYGVIYTSPATYSGEKHISSFVLGTHDRIDTETDTYTLQGKVTALFDSALKTALTRNGYQVHNAGEWNRKADELDLLPGTTLTLQLEKLDHYAFSDPIKVTGKYVIELRGFLGVPARGKVYSEIITLESKKVSVLETEEKLAEEFNALLSEAVDKVLFRLLKHLNE